MLKVQNFQNSEKVRKSEKVRISQIKSREKPGNVKKKFRKSQ